MIQNFTYQTSLILAYRRFTVSDFSILCFSAFHASKSFTKGLGAKGTTEGKGFGGISPDMALDIVELISFGTIAEARNWES